MTTDTEIKNERLARLCGWVHGCHPERCTGCPAPDYENSYDAQEAPGGPAALARARGWRLDYAEECNDGFRVGLYQSFSGEIARGKGPTLASAFCDAYTKALEAGE